MRFAPARYLSGGYTDMFKENKILCGSSSYQKVFYFNPEFDSLPEEVRKELQIMCVLFTEEVGGILRLEYDTKGNLLLAVETDENDLLFDEIGSDLKIKQIRTDKKDLLESLETYYRVFFSDNK